MISQADIAHYYFGQKVVLNEPEGSPLEGVLWGGCIEKEFEILLSGTNKIIRTNFTNLNGCRLALRDISSLTNYEHIKLSNIGSDILKTHYLLSIGVDLFNLIESGQAIDINMKLK